MAKKKQGNQETAEPPTPPVETGYTVGDWRGHVQYRCGRCAYDALDDERKILEHIRLMHTASTPPIRRTAGDPRAHEAADAGEGSGGDLFEVELIEVSGETDAEGIEHKTFTIKE